jgi:cytochrome oxidase Cu insertion factor (SCO1/SenC/PrrC family)
MSAREALLWFVFVAALTAHAHPPSPAPRGEPRIAAASADPKEAAARLLFTERKLLTQDGTEVSFFSDVLKDRVVLINFIFTHCPDACPLQTAKMSEVQKQLAASNDDRLRLVSISVDPKRDSPRALKAYASQFDAGPHWLFLTGEKANVDEVVRRLGQLTSSPSSHTTLFIAGNVRAGRWIKLHPDATPGTIVGHLRELIAPSP